MQSLLSRIEREYILHSFENETPELNILINNKLIKILKNEYKIKDETIFFKPQKIDKKNFIANTDKIKNIFFKHKELSFHFTTEVEEKNDIYFFRIPEKIFKNIENNDNENFVFHLSTSGGFKMKAKTIKEFPIAYSTKKASASSSKKLDDILNEIINYNKALELTTSLIFIDSKTVLIFCTENQANIVASSISTKIEFSIKKRKINASVTYKSFYPILNPNIKFFTDNDKQIQNSLNGILCLDINKMQEEDKRFLHEYAYSEKYGSLS